MSSTLLQPKIPWSSIGQVAHFNCRNFESLRIKLKLRMALFKRRIAGSGSGVLEQQRCEQQSQP